MKYSRILRLYFMLMATSAILGAQAQQPFDLDTNFRSAITERNVNSLLLEPDGKLVISGRMRFPEFPLSDRLLARLDVNGALDLSFNTSNLGGGKLTPWNGAFYVGTAQTVRRILPGGTQDPTFIEMNLGPYFSSGQGGDYHVYPDGRVLMTGVHVLSDSIRGFEGFHSLVWFSNTGYLDTTATHRKCDGSIDFIHPLPDGKFLLSGIFTTYEGQPAGRIFRVHPDGGLDTSFSTTIFWGQAYGCHHLDDGRILAAGRFQINGDPDTLHLIRLMPNGTLDPTFNNHLSFEIDTLDGVSATVTAVHPLGDGRIALLGGFDRVGGLVRRGLVLTDTAGQLLPTALGGIGSGTYTYMNFTYGSIRDMVPAPDGGYYIHGSFVGYDDGTVNDSTQRFVSRLYGLDVGVREVEKPLAVQVVPNPSTGPVRVELPEAIGPAMLQVVDAQGRVVRVQRVASRPAVLDLTGQAPGVYAVRVRTEAGRSGHARIVLQPGGR
ncbi:MAG: T9SS type A sorting domain-containing protein [Flavobacteriales bacterium]|nr:T9SS type A sorting domain-containing protein [Flavobacteriales bacterium]